MTAAPAPDPPGADGADQPALPSHLSVGDRPRIDVHAGNNAYTAGRDQINIAGDLNVCPASESVSFSLPLDTAAFTGRQNELDSITTAVLRAAETGGIIDIHAIDGMPGTGKTALAVHAAYQLTDRFTDGRLFLDLHAHTPGHRPTDPSWALAMLLLADGLNVRELPADLDGRAALWRNRTAAKSLLLILDNAASSSQVRPLLPGNPACLTLITSRRHLGDLPGRTASLSLDQLSAREAQDMFVRSAERPIDDMDAVATLVRTCGHLPMAITILARVYNQHRCWTMADLIAETETRLLHLSPEQDTVAAAFDISVDYLSDQRRRFLTLLGLHPGTSIDPYAAAALTDSSLQDATGHLDGLWHDNLLTETARRRYGMHDLVRAYTRDLVAAVPETEREQALHRLLDYYQHTATRAATVLAHEPWPSPDLPGQNRFAAPPVDKHPSALTWSRAERPNLHACLHHVTDTEQHARIIAFTAALAPIMRTDGPWIDAINLHTTAAETAGQVGDRLEQANALRSLGVVQWMTDNYPGATSALQQALDLYTALGNQLGQANTLSDLGRVRRLTDNYPGATSALQQALDLYTPLGNQLGQANTLHVLGGVRRLTDDYPGATSALQQALDLSTALGNRLGQANALHALGGVRRMTGDYRGATDALQQALDLYTTLGNRTGEANTWSDLGTVRRMTGDYPAATDALQQGLDLYTRLGNRLGQANTLIDLGTVRRMTGDYRGATDALQQALDLYTTSGDRGGEVEVLNEYGALLRVCGDLVGAGKKHRRSLDVSRQIGSEWDEAHALAGLGRCVLAAGRSADAIDLLSRAKEIFTRIGAAEAPEIAAELAAVENEQRPEGQEPLEPLADDCRLDPGAMTEERPA
ncbi:ATP-binding protein [Jidongwangia harbinensis]|uniref:ATP-binding protein n=1 Tax=Jidongwangia harbinensis TaxID=2878561 RepID=UPI001CD9DBC7|nr:tetratricopeptide repeat protein [Jidongwangia harbinensis]MCA2217045.1 tetratricopeptide repeat protein [Jidongwangia harbinensis]